MKTSERMARIARFHHAGELQGNAELTLSRSASHHLVTVLRTRQGDIIELFNGDGFNYRATVLDTGQRAPGKCAQLHVQTAIAALTESPVRITLIQAISRGDRMDTTLRQSVELGVSHVQPVHTRHSAKALDEKRGARKLEHWLSILVSASEQSGRACVPTLAPAVTLAQALEALGGNELAAPLSYVLDPAARQSLSAHLRTIRGAEFDQSKPDPLHPSRCPASIGLIIGPESGLDADEIELAVKAGAQAVTLGPRILRTETAGPACIALTQAILGDLGQ